MLDTKIFKRFLNEFKKIITLDIEVLSNYEAIVTDSETQLHYKILTHEDDFMECEC
jgi:hypothetical protein